MTIEQLDAEDPDHAALVKRLKPAAYPSLYIRSEGRVVEKVRGLTSAEVITDKIWAANAKLSREAQARR